jgi:hypothetical protein
MKRRVYAVILSATAAATLALSVSTPSNGLLLAEDKGPTVVTPLQTQ